MATTAPAAASMLGRYQVLKPLAKGGMAEVLLARAVGLKGFERHVVIKRIRVEHGTDQRAIDMFLDEARLVAALHHRNIVQVLDVGAEGDKYFFVMEYVHGRDTRELLRHVKDRKQQIPLEHVLTIITAAAAGLHHAHEQRGPDRMPLGIVHRDISPGNILVAFDGGVKVVDFGIAKAAQRSASTDAGEMKGKLGYLSPEQCNAEPVDRRTDVFLLGIVMWELVTVRRLFRADTRYEAMSMVVKGHIASPSRYRPDLPAELEVVIMKALARGPDERYQSAGELRLALEAYAARAGIPLSPGRLSDYLKEQFGDLPEPWLADELPALTAPAAIDPPLADTAPGAAESAAAPADRDRPPADRQPPPPVSVAPPPNRDRPPAHQPPAVSVEPPADREPLPADREPLPADREPSPALSAAPPAESARAPADREPLPADRVPPAADRHPPPDASAHAEIPRTAAPPPADREPPTDAEPPPADPRPAASGRAAVPATAATLAEPAAATQDDARSRPRPQAGTAVSAWPVDPRSERRRRALLIAIAIAAIAMMTSLAIGFWGT